MGVLDIRVSRSYWKMKKRMKKKNNNTPVSSFRLPEETLEKLDALDCKSRTEAVILAVNTTYKSLVDNSIDNCNTVDTI